MIQSTIVLLLCRKTHTYVNNLKNTLLNNNIQTYIIEDDPNIHFMFHGLCHIDYIENKHNPNQKWKSTAWDNAFYFIFNTLLYHNDIKYFYFIEDDVYSKNLNTFIDIIKYYSSVDYDLITNNIIEKKDSISDWIWWEKDPDSKYFDDKYSCASLNPLCRLSKKLIEKIYEYHKIYEKFFFHEFLFASLCKQYNLSILTYHEMQNPYIGKIIFRPCFDRLKIQDNKIYHPVKNQTMDVNL